MFIVWNRIGKIILCSVFLFSSPIFGQSTLAPIIDYVEHPDFRSARISPDGEHIALIVSSDDTESLYILDAQTQEVKAWFESPKNTGIEHYWWVNEERIVFTTSINVGGSDETLLTGNLLALNIDDSKKFVLAGPMTGEYAAYEVLDVLEGDHDNIMVVRWAVKQGSIARSRPEAILMDVYKKPKRNLNSRISNKRTSDEVSSPFPWGAIYTDNSGTVRIAYSNNQKGEIEVKVRQIDEWVDVTKAMSVSDNAAFSVLGYPIAFNSDDSGIYHLALSQHGTIGIALLNILSGTSTMLFFHEKYDVTNSDFIFSSDGKDLIGVTLMGNVPETHYFSDHPDVALNQSLNASLPGYRIQFLNFTLDERKGLAMVSGPTLPPALFLLDIDENTFSPLFSSRPKLQGLSMNTPDPISFTARDDTPIEGYLTRAIGVEGPAPLVVLVHGGPHGVRDLPVFDNEVKLLSSRGYSVLQVNYRGSGGYGVEFLEMGYRNWGQSMVDDIIDGTRYVVNEGFVDENKMCIMGASYGGYATLMAVARYPDLYKCAIGLAGVYDLELMKKSDIPFLPGGSTYLEQVVGSDKNELEVNSPVNLAEDIKVPVLLAAGGQDRRVRSKNSKSLRKNLKAAGNAPEWFYVSSAGHGFQNPENKEKYYTKVFNFLELHLKE